MRKVRHSNIYLSTFLGKSLNISNGRKTILASEELNIWVSNCWFRLLNFLAPLPPPNSNRTVFSHSNHSGYLNQDTDFPFFFFSLSLWCLHLLRRDSRVDSCRLEGSGLLWGLGSVAKDCSELTLSFPVFLILSPDFSYDRCVFSNLPADHDFYRKRP